MMARMADSKESVMQEAKRWYTEQFEFSSQQISTAPARMCSRQRARQLQCWCATSCATCLPWQHAVRTGLVWVPGCRCQSAMRAAAPCHCMPYLQSKPKECTCEFEGHAISSCQCTTTSQCTRCNRQGTHQLPRHPIGPHCH